MMNARARCSILAVPLLAALGCSDPVPLPAQGAISLSIQKPTSVNGSTCPDSGTTYSVGAPGVPSTSTPGDSLIDGDKGAHISCSVKGSGSTFAFSGSFQASTSVGDALPITVNFSNGVINSDGKGTAGVSVFTPKLAGQFTSPSGMDCAFQVIGGQVANGHIWASFSCPGITAPPSGLCAVGSSVIVFENCDGT